MATIYVNNRAIDVGNEKINLIQAARKGGIVIPYYCWHPALTVVASCRMCLVEVGERKPDGTVTMQPKVVPACQTPAKDGTVVLTESNRATHAEQQTLESLLINHPLDCPVCDKAGECLLQDYSYQFGRSQSRMIEQKNHPPNKDYIGDHIALFTDRCIMCSRCVRFTREVSGTAELQVINRGDHSEIDIFPDMPCNNKLAGNVVDLCPVGALCSKDFLYKQRVWYLKTQKSVCADCSTGCSIFIDQNKETIYRLRPRENQLAQGHFMCDEGRFGFYYVNSNHRIASPLVKRVGEECPLSWKDVLLSIGSELTEIAASNGSAVVGIFSPFLTCEEAYLLAKYLKMLSSEVHLALGPVPVAGENDTYPKDRHGRPAQPVKFTIRAEKCPNRRGVEEILRHFEGRIIRFDEVASMAGERQFQAAYVTAGYPPRSSDWANVQLSELQFIPFLIVQDLFPSALSKAAKYILPSASWAEKEGTFVNHEGLAQAIHFAARPPKECRTEGKVFLDLMQRPGLMHASTIRSELALEVPFFAPLATNDLGEFGLNLSAQPKN